MGSKPPKMREPAPMVRESLSEGQSAASSEREKAKKRRGYEATKAGTLLGGNQEQGGRTLLG